MAIGLIWRLKAAILHTFLVYGCMTSVHCLENSGETKVHCSIAETHFSAANCIRIEWECAWSSHEKPPGAGTTCQIALASGPDRCESPLQVHHAPIYNGNRLHSFWIADADSRSTQSYAVCIRSVLRSNDNVMSTASNWNSTTIQHIERMPPVIKKCSVFIRNDEVNRIRFEKREIFLYNNKDNIIIACEVDGKPFPSVKWCKDTLDCAESVSSNQHGSLNITKAEKHDEGVYVALVENRFGRAVSAGMHIRQAVLDDFKVVGGSSTLSHSAGDSFTLGCRIPVSIPTPDISWIKITNGQKPSIQFDQRLVLGTDGSLIILNAEQTDSGNYLCKVRNRAVDESLEGPETTVEVRPTSIFPAPPFIQSKNPSLEETVLGLVGDVVKLQCVFSGRPQPTIQWFKEVVPVIQNQRINFSADGYTLTITNLVKTDEGKFQCFASNADGNSSFNIKLIIHEPPVIVNGLESKNVTLGESVVFRCVSSGVPQPSIGWMINGRAITDLGSDWDVELSSDSVELTINALSIDNVCDIQCNVTNDYGYATSSAYLNIFYPTVINRTMSVSAEPEMGFVVLTCFAETDSSTPLYFRWYRGESTYITTKGVYTVFNNGSLLVNYTGHEGDFSGNYTCEAYNGLSTTSQTRFVAVSTEAKQEPIKSEQIIGISGAVAFLLLLLVLVLTIVCIILRKNRHRKLGKVTSSTFSAPGSLAPQLSYTSHADSRSNGSHECLMRDYDWNNGLLMLNDRLKTAIKEMYIPRERLQLQTIVGKGHFGRVYAALLRDPRDFVERVAVKTMKYKPEESEMVELFLKEAVIMKDFEHINVLGIRGITFDSDNSPMVILPYMANGDLRKYILDPHLDVTVLQLLMMGLQVARGMQHLSEKRFVHRDLAARNCMVNDRGVVKVADFGLSRQLLVRDYYRVESSGTTPVPVRWMAPECLEANLFTTMSDVWSFGVLMWELMTRGAVPYPDVENWQIPNHVQSGKRLEQPLFCPDIVYEIMQSCWEVQKENRPSFENLVENLQVVSQSAQPGARMSSMLYQNIVQSGGGGSLSDASKGSRGGSTSTMDYRV